MPADTGRERAAGGPRGAGGDAFGGVPGVLSSAPWSLPGSRFPPASQPRSPARVTERAGPALGRGGDHRPALWQRWGIHLAWQLLPRGGGRARPPPYRRAAAGRARSGGGDRDPLGRAACPCPLPRGPGKGAAGGPGPISILIAGLGAHLDPGLITRRTLGAPAGRARRSPFTPSPPPPRRSAQCCGPTASLSPSVSPSRPVSRSVYFCSSGPSLILPPSCPILCPSLRTFLHSHSSTPFTFPSCLCSFIRGFLCSCSRSPSLRPPTLLMDRPSEHQHMCPSAAALQGIIQADLALACWGRACSPCPCPLGGAAGPRPWPSVRSAQDSECT